MPRDMYLTIETKRGLSIDRRAYWKRRRGSFSGFIKIVYARRAVDRESVPVTEDMGGILYLNTQSLVCGEYETAA